MTIIILTKCCIDSMRLLTDDISKSLINLLTVSASLFRKIYRTGKIKLYIGM